MVTKDFLDAVYVIVHNKDNTVFVYSTFFKKVEKILNIYNIKNYIYPAF